MRRLSGVVCLVIAAAVASAGSPGAAHPELEARIAEFSALIAGRPGEAGLYLQRGRLYHDHGEWDRALADYEIVASLDPGFDRVHLFRAATLERAGLPEASLAAAERYRRAHPGDGEALVLRGRALVALGRSAEAADELAQAIERLANPSIDLRVALARALASDGADGLERALASLDAAVERVGPIVSLRLEAVALARGAGRCDLALARVDALIGETARPARLLVLRGEILAEAGRGEDAIASFREAVREIDSIPGRVRARPAFVGLRADALADAETLARGGSLERGHEEWPGEHAHERTEQSEEQP